MAAAIAVRLVRNPPRTAAAAALVSGYGLLAAILLMPTTRFGYLLYPINFFVWSYLFREIERDPALPPQPVREQVPA